MKIIIFDPYFDTLGGGERYTLQIVDFFLQRGDSIELAWRTDAIKNLSKKIFNIDINKAKINPEYYFLWCQKGNFFKKYRVSSLFDLTFFISDGSVPPLFAKKNILLFQPPFQDVGGHKIFNQIKLKFIYKIICYSNFTKKYIDKEYNVNSAVLHPCLGNGFHVGEKKNLIISIGRFDNLLHAKKQDILIKVFKEMITKDKLKGWELVLAGNLLGKNYTFIESLKKSSLGFPIKIIENISFSLLTHLYSQAKIYWHATGFGENLNLHPERAEHFGITILEAMASGCVPIVFNAGGLPEIVQDGKNGFLFNNLSNLKEITLRLISNKNLSEKIRKEAIDRTRDFTKEVFCKKLNEIIQ